jgi:hypothetical protein
MANTEMTNAEIMAMGLWLRFADFCRRHKFAIFLLLAIAVAVAVWIFLSRHKGEGSPSGAPVEWGDWRPGGG